MNNVKSNHEPYFHIVKRDSMNKTKKFATYFIFIFVALCISGLFCVLSSDKSKDFFGFFASIFDGNFGTERRIWILLREMFLLLGVSLAVIPAFKMKFWNLGANGQVLISCLVSYAVLFYFGGKIPTIFTNILMVVFGVLASVIWAVLPAIFKALFKTNESLFTLMLNYVAAGLVTTMITIWAPSGSGSLEPINEGMFPKVFNEHLLTIIVVSVLTVFMYFYLKSSKHGYELAVVGESENTARYVGINVKKVIVRTLVLSGIICGLMGNLITGSINGTVSTEIVNNMGFTAIMTSWLAKFNPLIMIFTCFLITFINKGMVQVRKDYGFYNDALANVVLGIIYFFIIATDFFINYKIIFRSGTVMDKVFTKVSAFFDKISLKLTSFFDKIKKNIFKKGGNK